jgi:tellurite resistance protein TerC
MDTVANPILWIAFAVFIAAMLALDLGVFNRKAHVIHIKEAAIWSAVWIALALAFNVFVGVRFGVETGQEFLTGYLIEKALSVDNLFVFYMIFRAFSVPLRDQHRVLFWGIVGAIILRTAMVFAGTALLANFTWVVYVFGAVLIATGVKMLARPDDKPEFEKTRIYRFVTRVLPTTRQYHGHRMFTREDGALRATPLFVVLVAIELMDVVFALDSILAILAITTDPFIVLTSNIFAVLGMRALYFVLANVAERFAYVQPGLALVLVYVGLKLGASQFIHVPVLASLGVVALLIGGSVVVSIIVKRKR